MGCVGCNDGCFDESVQLAQGPAGADGADGQGGVTTAGTNISVTGTGTSGDPYVVSTTGLTSNENNVLETGVTQVDVTNSSYGVSPDPVISKTINGTNESINGVGDIIRLNFIIIGEYAVDGKASKYDFKITFGGQTVLDTAVSTTYQLDKDFLWGSTNRNACKVQLDLIVSGTNTLTPVIQQTISFGDRAAKILTGLTSVNDAVLSSITVADLSGDNDLVLNLKSSDGTSNISLMTYEIIKLLKA